MEQQQGYTDATRQMVASLTVNRERTLLDMADLDADLLERSRDLAVRMGASEDFPLTEALDVEQTATLTAVASLLRQAHASPDRLVFAEAEMRAEEIGGMLDEIAAAHRAGDPNHMETLRTNVGITIGAFGELIRSAA